MPDEVATRIRARIAAELDDSTVGPARPGRRGLRVRRAGVVLAAAAVVGALGAVAVLRPAHPGPVRVAGASPEELLRAAADADAPAGPAVDPGWVRSCLTVAGATDPAAPLLASRPYPVAGEPGVLLVLGTPQAGRYRLVVVPPDCGPGTARLLADAVVP
ncbi:hypothetical protein [Pseudonocardia parietis]|uniref:Uncharacterized protein n=1 Tax=Pseudonocardia parietis TaxID=570936 RepID=A0ABS4VLQ7_9PSEU|nr:hypothetical protein [Pseudonocardia parietis]MBP2364852.1 hypothetical protein [Pseudonocardia parietis]